jgi:hypothetical protein
VVFATQNAQPSESEAVKNETRASRRAQRTVDRLRVSGTGHLSSWFKAIRPQTERSTSRSPGRTHDRVTRESTDWPARHCGAAACRNRGGVHTSVRRKLSLLRVTGHQVP